MAGGILQDRKKAKEDLSSLGSNPGDENGDNGEDQCKDPQTNPKCTLKNAKAFIAATDNLQKLANRCVDSGTNEALSQN